MNEYLVETRLLDFNNETIQKLVWDHRWGSLDPKSQILSIYNYVRDSIPFGYNRSDDISASQVIQDGYGQCNTKSILFMALLRAVGVPCRIHGFAVDKKLQKGAMTGLIYQLTPRELLHSWVEVYYEDQWLDMEGIILDVPYITNLQRKFNDCNGSFCGYGVATDNFKDPSIYWNQNNTYIQKEGIVKDFGSYVNPDQLFAERCQALGKIKKLLFERVIRHIMNGNIRRIRELSHD